MRKLAQEWQKPALWMAVIMGSMSLTGCLAAVAAGAYIAGEEIAEDDGDFDPLDEVVDGEKDKD